MANENTALTMNTAFEVNGEEVKLNAATVRNYLTNGDAEVSDQEVIMFISLCKYQKLNPFLNEAYLIKFKSNNPKYPAKAQIIVSKEAFMKRAETHPQYDGFSAGIIVEREGRMIELEGAIKLPKDQLLGAYAYIYRKDRDKPVSVKISLEEFGKGQATWKQMPMNMIRKTAIVNAMREAFPENLAQLYTEEEQQEVPKHTTIEEEITEKQAQTTIGMEQDTPQEVPQMKEEKEQPQPVEVQVQEYEDAQYKEVEIPPQHTEPSFDLGGDDPF